MPVLEPAQSCLSSLLRALKNVIAKHAAAKGWAVRQVFVRARRRLGEILSAFEFLDRGSLELTQTELEGVRDPLPGAVQPFYLVVETSGSNAEHDYAKLEARAATMYIMSMYNVEASAPCPRSACAAAGVLGGGDGGGPGCGWHAGAGRRAGRRHLGPARGHLRGAQARGRAAPYTHLALGWQAAVVLSSGSRTSPAEQCYVPFAHQQSSRFPQRRV